MPEGPPAAPTCGSQIVEELILVQLQRIGRICCSNLLWDGSMGNGGRLSMSLRAFKVSVPGATVDPSSAWREAEISPKDTKVLARSTRLVTVSCWVRLLLKRNWLATSEASKLSLRRSNHSPDAHFWTHSNNLFLGTLPPLGGFVFFLTQKK